MRMHVHACLYEWSMGVCICVCTQASLEQARLKDAQLVALKPHNYLTEKDLAKTVQIVLQETQTEFMLEVPSECASCVCLCRHLLQAPFCVLCLSIR